jgi:hypothetical protein
MPFDHHALIARIGNEAGAREEFARLTAALAELTTRVRRIREDPGDWGIDSFAGRLDEGEDVAVWQAKFFTYRIAETQKQQIRDSFTMARTTAAGRGHRLVQWTLVIPLNMSAPETKWWDGWKGRQEEDHGLRIELWDRHRIETLLRLPDAERIDAEFFPPFAAPTVTPRPVQTPPAEMSYDELLFIAQLTAAGIPDVRSAKKEFFNAELLVRDVKDKAVEQELETLETIRSETESIWSANYNDACTTSTAGDRLPSLHGAVMNALLSVHLAQGATLLRLNVVHRYGTMHQIVENGEAGWVRDYAAVAERHRNG